MATLPIPYPSSAAVEALEPTPAPRQRLPHRWSYGRGYAVIALLAPLVLGSLALLYLHTVLQVGQQSFRGGLRKSVKEA